MFFNFIGYSQSNIYDYFDKAIGKENIAISNGKMFMNTFRTLDTDQFYNSKFSIETIVYENESYNNVNLKYDILRDILIFRPYGESENFGIELIGRNVNSFSLRGKKFVNLSLFTNATASFVKGYYEENTTSDKVSFYIKHKKETKEVISNLGVYNSFQNYNEYVVLYNDSFSQIKKAKDLVKIFPTLTDEIKTFETENNTLLKTDRELFFEKLIKKINSLI